MKGRWIDMDLLFESYNTKFGELTHAAQKHCKQVVDLVDKPHPKVGKYSKALKRHTTKMKQT